VGSALQMDAQPRARDSVPRTLGPYDIRLDSFGLTDYQAQSQQYAEERGQSEGYLC
jgi:hypothetical protein